MTYVKICGITNVEDARFAVAAGADALGLNFVPSSKRRIGAQEAIDIANAVGDAVELVAVVADLPPPELQELRAKTGIRWLQLHGAESLDDLASVLPEAYKAVAISDAADVERARRYGGARLLVDAKSARPGELGGTGRRFDWALAAPLREERDLIVAGGLDPSNVADAVRALAPFGVDVASGVERAGNPRQKDPDRVRRFIAAVRVLESGC